jgi:hypothetical protein
MSWAGIPSVMSSFLVLLFFPNFPETVDWLSDEERALAVNRLKGVASTQYVFFTIYWRIYLITP